MGYRRFVGRLCGLATLIAAMAYVHPRVLAQNAPGKNRRPLTLWVREVHGQALYWVNNRPVGRAPLTGLEKALGSNFDVTLSVVMDSRVPMEEIFGIDGILDKIPIRNARYFVFFADQPNRMWEFYWKPKAVPLPAPPPAPKASRSPAIH